MGAIIQIIGSILALVAGAYLDYKAKIASEQMAARRAAANALSAAAKAEAEAAKCITKASKMRGFADRARKLGKDATDAENRVKGIILAGAKFKQEASSLRLHGDMLAREALKPAPGFWRSFSIFQFRGRGLASSILGVVSLLLAAQSVITILQNEIDKLQAEIDSYANTPCPPPGSGASNLSLEQTGLLELLELID